ncbi:MAG: hypothetical protein HZA34_03315 [Candidatus Pacebacteria bacterium]|nr:hypothetical protein [Candidatus Paceibacterota bacterium]
MSAQKQKAAILPTLIQTLHTQLDYFFTHQLEKSKKRTGTLVTQHEVEKLFDWAREFALLYLQSRTARALDLETQETAQAQELARSYIGAGNHDFFATCVDGRNMPTVMFSKPPHVGGVLRAPAGIVTGFMEGARPNAVFIDTTSFVVQQIEKLLLDRPHQTVFYGLDSHLGCAARGLIHATEGGKQKDKGLRADIVAKMMTARGILELRRRLFVQKREVAEVIPVFFSYDPHAGSVVMGLETCVDEPSVIEHGFTEEVLTSLAKAGRIVRALDLLEKPEVEKAMKAVLKPGSADFRMRFPQSLLANWKAVHELYKHGEGQVYHLVLQYLRSTYEKGVWKIGHDDNIESHMISEKTLRQKAKFLMKNMVTRWSIAGIDHHWPYEHHKEDLVVITDGGYAPFPQLDAFAVFSRDRNALLPNTKLTIDLIRQFRENGNASDPLSTFHLSKEQFISAPVLISNKAILRGSDEESWAFFAETHVARAFAGLNWDSDTVLSWQKQDVLELIKEAVRGQRVKIDAETMLMFVDVVYELFDRMRLMMQDKAFRHMILHGNVVVLNTVVDNNRKPRLVIPFVV